MSRWEDFIYADGCTYPLDVQQRYIVRNGKFGPYFHDTRGGGHDMALADVVETLNRYALRKAQLTWMIAVHGEPKS